MTPCGPDSFAQPENARRTSRAMSEPLHQKQPGMRVPMHIRVAVFAVVAELTVSANLLTWLGIPYVSAGGAVVAKIHPGAYLAALACLIRIMQPRRPARAPGGMGWRHPCLAVFMIALLFCVVEALIMTGQGHVIVLLDSFMPAGLLALALCDERSDALIILRRVLQALFAVNVIVAIAEVLMHQHVVPLYLDGAAYTPRSADFRPTGLCDHPLTGAAITMIAIMTPPKASRAHRLRVAYVWLMVCGLIAFAGRMAIIVSISITVLRALPVAFTWLLRRQMPMRRRFTAAAIAVVVLIAIVPTACGLGLGERLIGHLYWDPSAQVRLRQWMILESLDIREWLFGCRREDLFARLNGLRLSYGVEVIENFWLLMFLALGAIGFAFFAAGFLTFLFWCARRGRASLPMVVGLLLVTSSSNSLGRKSPLLVVLVAAVVTDTRQQPMYRVAKPPPRMTSTQQNYYGIININGDREQACAST